MPQIAGDDCVHVVLSPLIESVATALKMYVEKKAPNVLWRIMCIVTTAISVYASLQNSEAEKWMKMVSLLASKYLAAEEKRKLGGFNPFESIEVSAPHKGFSSELCWLSHC